MKRLLTTALFMAIALLTTWSQEVNFKFSDGISNESLKNTAEHNISQLLTNINKAAKNKSTVSFNGVNIGKKAKEEFLHMWDFMPFSCDDANYVEKCVQTTSGYLVRGIPVTMLSTDYLNIISERGLTINFSSDGTITGVFFSLERHIFDNILITANNVTDIRRKEKMLNFVEHYRSFYDQKDLKSIQDIFSDDALIITENKIIRKEGSELTLTEIKGQVKTEFIKELKSIFVRKQPAKMVISDIKVLRHPTNPDVYLVQFIQDLRSAFTNGNEQSIMKGEMTMLWFFPKNDGYPSIWIRTLQSDKIEPSNKITLDDFHFH